MSPRLGVAVLQMQASPEREENFEKVARMVGEACEKHKPHIIALPELFHFRGKTALEKENAELLPPVSEKASSYDKEKSPSLFAISELAKKHNLGIMAGSILEKNPDDENKPLNTAFYVNKEGKLIAKYSKMHLFDVEIPEINSESNSRAHGCSSASNMPVFSEDFDLDGKSVKVKMAMAICYDLRFPELFRTYMFQKEVPDLVFLPSAFSTKTGPFHWEPLIRSRAIENSLFMVAPNQVGKSVSGFACHGESLITNPWGDVLAKADGESETIIFSELDLGEIDKYRKVLPLNNARLHEIYNQ